MVVTDKNQAMINYLVACPNIFNSPLYFNFINAKNNTNQFLTTSSDEFSNVTYIDGSVKKIYTFSILSYKSATDIAVVHFNGFPNENISDMSDVQALINWVQEQNKLKNFPDFGSDCEIESMIPVTNEPNFEGIDEQASPPLAVYSTSIRIEYIDTSEVVWG